MVGIWFAKLSLSSREIELLFNSRGSAEMISIRLKSGSGSEPAFGIPRRHDTLL
jgi:hypothetical protein